MKELIERIERYSKEWAWSRQRDAAETILADCRSALEAQAKALSLRDDELRGLKHTVVTTIGGVDHEGFPTCELNYLQRLRILLEKEKALSEAEGLLRRTVANLAGQSGASVALEITAYFQSKEQK